MSATITFVSLGPGDPELVSLKALRVMQQCDTVFYPITLKRKGGEVSRSGDILEALEIEPSKREGYFLPMSKDRQFAYKAYEDLAEKVIMLADQGKRIAITAEGDGGFYSSSQYIKEILNMRGYESQRISGVPSFIDCASLADIHLASGETALEIIPSVEDAERLLTPLREGKNIVLMKISQSEDVIKKTIMDMPNCYQLHYIENRGLKELEFYTRTREEILVRRFPYFSILMIIQA